MKKVIITLSCLSLLVLIPACKPKRQQAPTKAPVQKEMAKKPAMKKAPAAKPAVVEEVMIEEIDIKK